MIVCGILNRYLTKINICVNRQYKYIKNNIKPPKKMFFLMPHKISRRRCCVRYISNNCINKSFLGFIELKELHTKALNNMIQLFLCFIKLHIKSCIGQSYNKVLLCEDVYDAMSKNSCPYLHYYTHRINPVLVNISKHISVIHNTIGILKAIYSYQSSSLLRHSLFIKSQKNSNKTIKIS